ncbi:MAG: SURF1 family protein [Geminicoccaceae bacterium]|nr:MAG: SURF1 family protein [Geminicoccaceae bacterium]
MDFGRRFSSDVMAFRPGLWPTLTVLLSLPILATLGSWQLDRSAWKTALIAELEARQAEAPVPLDLGRLDAGWEHRRVVVSASLAPEPALRFGVEVQGIEPGHRILQLATLDDGTPVVVNRGWFPERAAVPLVTPGAAVELIGVVRWIEDRRPAPFTPANDAPRNRWYWYEWDALETAFATALLPLVIDVTEGPTGPGLPVPQPVVVDLPNNHLGYAMTWFGLALGLAVIYVAFGLQRGRGAA